MLPNSIQIQPQSSPFLKPLTFAPQNFKNLHKLSAISTTCLPINPKPSSSSISIFAPPFGSRLKKLNLKSSAASTAADPFLTDGDDLTTNHRKEKLGVVVKPLEKGRLVLKFIWMEKEIGIAVNQVIPGHGTIPLSPYYFWPRKDAWEELKLLLESKPWISQLQRVHLLNQATDIINLWQEACSLNRKGTPILD